MVRIPATLEWIIGRALSASKGYDGGLFISSPAVKYTPAAVNVSSDIGPSGCELRVENTGFPGGDREKNIFPTISWRIDPALEREVKEYLVVCEDPDAPVPPSLFQATHGVFFGIPKSKTRITHDDLQLDETRSDWKAGPRWAKGGFRLGQNIKGETYGGPRPPRGHGVHRYFFEVVALKECLEGMGVPTRAELLRSVEGKVLAHGSWVGCFVNTGL
jgi:phosphatidylethanolamine-binding protein (PEBP) family uncharacterized protein